jgi:hypothetical protein
MLVFITATAQGGIVNNIYKQLVTAALLATAALPGTLMAEAASDSGATPLSAAARLDFQINIPGILRFRVGSDAGTIDLVQFSPSAANLGDDSDIAGTGGDLTGGEVTVDLFSNAGQITITPTNNSGGAGLDNGLGDNISYDEILTASSDAAVLPVPVLSDAGGTTSQPPPTSGLRVTNLTESWTYTYDNTDVYPEGTYGGINTQGGRVTYTAASP